MKNRSEGQLWIFDWTPPTKVICFPQARRVGRAREIARNIQKDSSAPLRAEKYRERCATELLRQLVDKGISDADAKREVASFLTTVDSEIARLRTMARLGLNDVGGRR